MYGCGAVTSGKPNTEEDFWAKVKAGTKEECWFWIGKTAPSGYGFIKYKAKTWTAHRLAFYLTTKTEPEVVCHKCDVRSCCNPHHLFGGTHADNVKDKIKKDRQPRGASHYRSYFNEKDILDIRKRKALGQKQRDIAKVYGVSEGLISKIVKKTNWKHI